jgi:protocatechuate 3,4-dioxygenase beta subunit
LGQATTSLRGTVADPSGAAVPKASVTLTNIDVNTPRSTTTGPQGDYSFISLPPGNYQLVIETPGFERYVQTKLQLLVNTPATVEHAYVTVRRQYRVGCAIPDKVS